MAAINIRQPLPPCLQKVSPTVYRIKSGHTSTVNANFLVVLLKSSEIFTSLGEFTFLHTLTDVPVNEGTLGVAVKL
jgi:hypothetical protein